MKGEKKKKIREKKITKIYFFLASLLLISLIILILSSFGVFKKKQSPEFFSIEDECFPIFGSIVHNLKNIGDCKIKCSNNCEFRDMKFFNSSFTYNENSCHSCDCYCE